MSGCPPDHLTSSHTLLHENRDSRTRHSGRLVLFLDPEVRPGATLDTDKTASPVFRWVSTPLGRRPLVVANTAQRRVCGNLPVLSHRPLLRLSGQSWSPPTMSPAVQRGESVGVRPKRTVGLRRSRRILSLYPETLPTRRGRDVLVLDSSLPHGVLTRPCPTVADGTRGSPK